MERKNVTVSLPSSLLRLARHLAVDKGLSLSGFLTLLLQEQIGEAGRYRAACRRQLDLLQEGLQLGTRGHAPWRREDLHER